MPTKPGSRVIDEDHRPNMAIGTDTRITIGSRKLLNCAARAR
ncbi:MAG: hypothetical protein R3F00_01600 [Dokdonella sp.]